MAGRPAHGATITSERPPGRARAVAPPGRAGASAPDAVGTLLHLQRTAGNRAVARMVQRKPLTLEEKEQNLSSARYAGQPTLEKAYDNSPPLRRGDRGDGVAAVQKGLVDNGFAMPGSVKPDGTMDGVYGRETHDVVIQFQEKYHLDTDGVVGRDTMGKLDELAKGDNPRPPRPPEIEATTQAMGDKVVASMQKANTVAGPNEGIWYDYNYHAEHLKDPDRYPWNDDWRSGLADPTMFEKIGWMDWRLKPGRSAAEGIRSWLKGLTIAECLSTITAIEIDAMRAAVGDDEFDKRYGSDRVAVPTERRLRIKAGNAGTPLEGMTQAVHGSEPGAAGTIGKRPVAKGDWVYFYNHPKYLLKHPGGAWQGENAVCMGDSNGEQQWAGLGAGPMTERQMLQEMADAYNGGRNGDDYARLLDTYAASAPEVRHPNQQYRDRDTAYLRGLYEKYLDRIPSKYREDSGEFADQVDPDRILNDPPYELDGTTRVGGYYGAAAARLDPAKVAAMRGS